MFDRVVLTRASLEGKPLEGPAFTAFHDAYHHEYKDTLEWIARSVILL
jgi:hypothetical protein